MTGDWNISRHKPALKAWACLLTMSADGANTLSLALGI